MAVLTIIGCSENYLPKPKAYHRIVLPERSYQSFEHTDCPFSFQYPVYSKIVKDSLFFNEASPNPCWMDVSFDYFRGSIHVSYKAIDEDNSLGALLEDAHKLTSKHMVKAEFVDDFLITNPHGINGMLFGIGGNTASAYQFYLTDSTEHFVRGALYFEIAPNIDSMALVIDFIKEDMDHLIDTFDWN